MKKWCPSEKQSLQISDILINLIVFWLLAVLFERSVINGDLYGPSRTNLGCFWHAHIRTSSHKSWFVLFAQAANRTQVSGSKDHAIFVHLNCFWYLLSRSCRMPWMFSVLPVCEGWEKFIKYKLILHLQVQDAKPYCKHPMNTWWDSLVDMASIYLILNICRHNCTGSMWIGLTLKKT